MLIVLAHNTTGTKSDGTSDYDVEVRINERVIFKGQVIGHIRDHGAAILLHSIANQIEFAAEKAARKESSL